jgi:hypothetical protein
METTIETTETLTAKVEEMKKEYEILLTSYAKDNYFDRDCLFMSILECNIVRLRHLEELHPQSIVVALAGILTRRCSATFYISYDDMGEDQKRKKPDMVEETAEWLVKNSEQKPTGLFRSFKGSTNPFTVESGKELLEKLLTEHLKRKEEEKISA